MLRLTILRGEFFISFFMLVFKRSFGKGSVSLREMGEARREIAEVRTKRDTRIKFGAMDIDREHPNNIRGNKQTKGRNIFYLLSTESLRSSTDAGEKG